MKSQWLLVVVALSTQACMSIEIRELRKRVTAESLLFPGLGAAQGTVISEARQFDVSFASDLWNRIDFTQLKSMKFVPAVGVQKLDFVNEVVIDLRSKSTLPAVTLAQFSSKSAQTADGTVDMQVNSAFDHTDYLRENIPFDLSLQFKGPAQDWSVDVDLVFDVGIKFSL